VLASDFMVNSRGDLWIGLGKRAAHTVRHSAILDHGWKRMERMRKKSLLPVDHGPQQLKPAWFLINYVRPEGRTLQKKCAISAISYLLVTIVRLVTGPL
jgi:hypothetical protein